MRWSSQAGRDGLTSADTMRQPVLRLLHLTDLHLGPNQPTDDVKTPVIPLSDRAQRFDSIADTLTALGEHLIELGQRFDAIIISGDITNKGTREGFAMLPALLDKLGPAKPSDPRRVVVVPGNHDIQQGTPPGSAERYANFVELVQEQGYTGPPIEGVDFNDKDEIKDLRRHYVLDAEAGWLILPINCANYYGTHADLSSEFSSAWNSVLADLPPNSMQRIALEQGLARLRFSDVARISKTQFKGLRSILRSAGHEARQARDALLRVAVIHHHLLPVSDDEEVKAFESLTNLGAFRTFLAQQRIQVLIHGHKHSRLVYWDHIFPSTGASSREHRLLVIAGETVKGSRVKDEIAQLVDLKVGDCAPSASVVTLPHCQTVAEVRARMPSIFDLWDAAAPSDGVTVVRGATVDETYDRLLAIFARHKPESLITNVVCDVTQGATCAHLPKAYPEVAQVATSAQRQRWLQAMVEWWQTDWSWPMGYPYFSHGGRIHRRIGGVSQWKLVLDSLNRDPRSSRGVVILVEPGIDVYQAESRKFPAFTMLQLLVSGDEAEPQLDVIGFFRKHEMKWWWPINVAELHYLQREALKLLTTKRPQLSAGRIITVSAIAKVGETIPQVAIPIIDRLADEEPTRLFRLAYACFHPPKIKEQAFAEWRQVIIDLRPPTSMSPDGVPVAIRGLKQLIGHLDALTVIASRRGSRALIETLELVLEKNQIYAGKIDRNEVDPAQHAEWKTHVDLLLDKVLEIALLMVNSGKPVDRPVGAK